MTDQQIFDAYACAALTGLLANNALLTWNDKKTLRHIVKTALSSASCAMMERKDYLANEWPEPPVSK